MPAVGGHNMKKWLLLFTCFFPSLLQAGEPLDPESVKKLIETKGEDYAYSVIDNQNNNP